MKKWIILGISLLGMLFLSAFTTHEHLIDKEIQNNEITAIINKNTTEKELEDLKKFFSDNGIEMLIKKVKFNDRNEIISLNITLRKGNAKSQFSSTSNRPIPDIELGFKNENLYITNSGMFDILAWKNQSNINPPIAHIDSLLQKHNFNFNFDFSQELDSLFNNSSFDIQKLKDQITNSFELHENEDGSFFFNGHRLPNFHDKDTPKYNFTDHPDIDKLIIIDGKESDFETLDQLAKADKLIAVDFLKPNTAISLYGQKAKDGAIIATSKPNKL